MLQEGPPDLTKWLPWWAPYLFGLSVFAYQWGKTARERLKKGKTAEVRERDDEIEKALKPLREQLKEANELKELRKEKTDELEKQLRDRDDRITVLDQKLHTRAEMVDELQQTVYQLRGDIVDLSRRLAEAEKRKVEE